MSYTLALLREDLRTHLGMDVSDLPNTDADRLLNRSWRFLCTKIRFSEKDAVGDFTTAAGVREYNLTVDEDAIQRIVILEETSEKVVPLKKIDDYKMFGERSEDEGAWSMPTSYSRRGQVLILDPVPDDVYTISIKYLRTLSDLEVTGPPIPSEWHEVILWGAIARGFSLRGDLARSERYMQQTMTYINALDTKEEKEVEDKHTSGVRILRRSYP